MDPEQYKTILLVEDEILIAAMERSMLERNGYRVATASSGEKAVRAVEENHAIDLVLMDINLGDGMDGTEAARRILALRDIPLAFLSSHTEPAVVETTEGITSYGYIVKNSGETVLVASVKMAFKLHEARLRERAHGESLVRKMEELERFHRLTVNREIAMIALKGEVNALLGRLGEHSKYPVADRSHGA
ncbi:MAG: response regulator [Treponema sp.]|nr:response regulator [Treponema sp.]